jgi:hypothetical protein
VKIKENLLFILATIFLTKGVHAQNCNCYEIIDEAFHSVQENYIGFYFLSPIQKANLSKLKKDLLSQSQSINNKNCIFLVSKYLSFFKDPHLLAIDYSDDTIINYPIRLSHNINNRNQNNPSMLNGYWMDNAKKNMVYIDSIGPNLYQGVVVKSMNNKWKPGDKKMEVFKDGDKWYCLFRLGDKSKFCEELTLSDSFFTIQVYQKYFRCFLKDTILLTSTKVSPKNKPEFHLIDKNTAILKIPVSAYRNIVDSIFTSNKAFFKPQNHLIVDVRNNSGGTINVYYPILDLVKPENIYWETYYGIASKTLLVQDKELLKKAMEINDTSAIKGWKEEIDLIEKSKSKIYRIEFKKIDFLSKQKIGKISILMNSMCMSATELFILAAKQSKKVKVFGTNSYGCVDYGNLVDYQLKMCNYVLTIPSSKLKRSVKYPLDYKGIKPDVDLHKINESKWIEYLRKIN